MLQFYELLFQEYHQASVFCWWEGLTLYGPNCSIASTAIHETGITLHSASQTQVGTNSSIGQGTILKYK